MASLAFEEFAEMRVCVCRSASVGFFSVVFLGLVLKTTSYSRAEQVKLSYLAKS